jgi:hypothetical protein
MTRSWIGVNSLPKSLPIAAEAGLRHLMKIQRYDVRNLGVSSLNGTGFLGTYRC